MLLSPENPSLFTTVRGRWQTAGFIIVLRRGVEKSGGIWEEVEML